MTMSYFKLMVVTLTTLLFLSGCGQSDTAKVNSTDEVQFNDFQVPFSKFPNIDNCLDSNRTKKLVIPYLQNGLYGLCDYKGDLILSPRFEEIEMINFSYPYYWAGNKGKLTLFDLEGKQALDINGAPIPSPEMSGFSEIEPIEDYKVAVFLIQINNSKHSLDSIYNRNSKQLYLFLSEFMKPPFKFYYKWEEGTVVSKSRFFKGEFLKVETIDGLCTYLNEHGEELFEPVPKCMLVNFGYVKLENEKGKEALYNFAENWKTDYLFSNIQNTRNKDIFEASIWEAGKWMKCIIYGNGKYEILKEKEVFEVISEEYSIYTRVKGNETNYLLWNNRSFESIKEIFSDNYFRLHGDEVALELNSKFMLTPAGDTINRPSENRFQYINKDILFVSDGKRITFFNGKGEEIISFIGEILSGNRKNYIRVKDINEKLGLINLRGKVILPVAYDDIRYGSKEEDYIFAKQNGFYRIYDFNGNQASELEIDQLRRVYDFSISSCSSDFGSLLKLKVDSAEYVVTYGLNLVAESNSENPIIRKSDFVISNDDRSVRRDFKKCSLPRRLSEYAVFEGEDFVHIFQMDGKYISSFEGQFHWMEQCPETTGESINPSGLSEFSGIIRMGSKEGKKYWIRAKDGLAYRDF